MDLGPAIRKRYDKPEGNDYIHGYFGLESET